MSLTDDIFDVDNRLEGTPEEAAFNRIIDALNYLGSQHEILKHENKTLMGAIKIITMGAGDE